MKRRKAKRGQDIRKGANLKTLKCSEEGCNRTEVVDSTTVSVICCMCVQKKVGVDPKFLVQRNGKVVKKLATGFPRGYHLYKRFVHPDGRVFEKGVENESLRGTLPVTEVKVSTLSKFERRKKREEKELRKMKRLAKKYKKQQKEKKNNA